jgi:hypothetical protein
MNQPTLSQIGSVFARYANLTLGGGSATTAVIRRCCRKVPTGSATSRSRRFPWWTSADPTTSATPPSAGYDRRPASWFVSPCHALECSAIHLVASRSVIKPLITSVSPVARIAPDRPPVYPYVRVVTTREPLVAMSVDIRGNTDESWSRAVWRFPYRLSRL